MLQRSRLVIYAVIAACALSWAGQARAQNTAPVPTTFSIISPDDGNAASLINSDYKGLAGTANTRIFYGGDLAYTGDDNAKGFNGFQVTGDPEVTRKARGNKNRSRLTLGGMEGGLDPTYPAEGSSYVTNLGSFVGTATSYDYDDIGASGAGTATFPDYQGCNGFIAINEGDTLDLQISGFIDPNNSILGGSVAQDGIYTGRGFKSAAGDGIAGNQHDDNIVRYEILNKPAGATFTTTGQFRWVPSFVQGDGGTDDSQHGGYWFIDANISNGSTSSETTPGSEALVGPGNGELRDSLYVIYFKAIDDSGQGNDNGIDSLFILVNDSLPNPSPQFTKRTLLRKDSLGVQATRTYNFLAGQPDTLFSVAEGDSVVITYFAQDQDSAQGETNDAIAIGMLWNDNLLGVAKGGSGSAGNLDGFKQFIKRPGTVDTLVFDTASTLVSGSATSFKIKLQIPYNLARSSGKPDSLVVMVSDGSTIVTDTFALKVRNTNRPPIWDRDTTSKPSDSVLVYSSSPATAQPSAIQTNFAITVNNDQTDSTFFSLYVYDPDFLASDSSGQPLTFSAGGNHQGTLNVNTGLNIFSPSVSDTITYNFTITATDSYSASPKSATQAINFRVAPAPNITKVTPASGAVNQEFTIYGSGFGLYDNNGADTSRVQFYATTNGVRQNIDANIIAWSKEKIVASVPFNTPTSPVDLTSGFQVPDTIIVRSAIYGGYDTYPFVVLADNIGVENLVITNITSTSAIVSYRTNYTGVDSLVLANAADTLDIHSANFSLPTFVEYDGGMSQISSPVHIFQDGTSNADGVHVIQLSELSPNTLYRFFIGSANGNYFADSLRNSNGPFGSKKIDTTTKANNKNLDAFRFRTLPSSSGSGDLYTVVGKVYYRSGAATGASVTLKVVSLINFADTSLPITTSVASDSTWLLDLGNLRSNNGGNYVHAQGDFLLFEFDGAEKGFEQYDTTRAAAGVSPMTIRTIKLQPFVKYTLDLKTGLNLVGLPVKLNRGQPTTAIDLLDLIVGGSPSLTRYVPATGTQETIARSAQGGYYGVDDFTLGIQEGYFVKVSSSTDVALEGRVYTNPLPLVNFPGPGLYFVTNPGQDNNVFYSWDARQILQNLAQVTTVYRFNNLLQSYETFTRIGTTLNGVNFAFTVGEGYIFEVNATGSWNPSGPGALLASTGGSNDAVGSPSIVVEIGDKIDQAAPAGAALSNISSSAALFTWGTGSLDPGQLRLSLADGTAERIIQPRVNKLAGGLNYALVTGLDPDKNYVYRLESSVGTPLPSAVEGSFTTARVGAGMKPYSLYGRLEDARGKTLSGMLVLVRLTREQEGLASGYLSAVSDEQGNWVVNLANLKVKLTGEVYEWREGDRIELTVTSGAYSAVFHATVKPGSPHNVALDLERDGQTDQNAQDKAPVSAALPKAYTLSQNFPNPFNPSTTIQFSIPEGGSQAHIRLDVFNLRGQVVATLVDRVADAGEYRIQWDGTDIAGRRVPSGVYFYRLTTPEYKATRKMVILK